MVAPPYFPVPPTAYGGVEAVIADLVDALVERGHRITLIGAGGHGTQAQRFVTTRHEPDSARLGQPLPELLHAALTERVLERLEADIVHDHTLAGPLVAGRRKVPTVLTAHGPVTGDEGAYYRAVGSTIAMVAISQAQRASAPELPWAATIHNAIRADTYPYRAEKEGFALFLGRFHPDKGPHLAIQAARGAGLPIVLAGKCAEPIEREYFEQEVRPLLGTDTELVGVVGGAQKRDLLARACCLVFPVCWEEPFGLVMVEAMACGTPVVGLRRGAVPEVVLQDETGVIVDRPEDLPEAIARAGDLDPAACRKHVDLNYSVDIMAAGYERAYWRVLRGNGRVPAQARLVPSAADDIPA